MGRNTHTPTDSTDSPPEEGIGELRLRLTLSELEKLEMDKMNGQLLNMLREAKDHIVELREEVVSLTDPPNPYGTFVEYGPNNTAEILSDGRRVRVNIHSSVPAGSLEAGHMVLLNEAMHLIESCGYNNRFGEIVTIKEFLPDTEGNWRLLVDARMGDERVATLGECLRSKKLSVGDHLLCDMKSNYVIEKMPKVEAEEVGLEAVPDIKYEDIGGLGDQIRVLRDSIELPYLYSEIFADHKLKAPKGVLLYGPPGCGKTLIAKAVANELSNRIEEKTGEPASAYFLNVKGPELLNKYVGETESKIRDVFNKARDKASNDVPVVIFFDEMDSLFRQRGSGVSSDMEATVVAQFLAEIDGVEALENVIVIGATNRQDLIDPAVLRPGRLDLKVKVSRPDKEGAEQIFSKYMTDDLPLHETIVDKHDGDRQKACADIIDVAIKNMYSEEDENKFLEVTYAKGERETFFFRDFSSGAMIENIVARAKRKAVKRQINTDEYGIKAADLIEAVREEFKENEDLPNTTNPDDWARISGKKGEKIVGVRTLIEPDEDDEKPIEDVLPGQGQYL